MKYSDCWLLHPDESIMKTGFPWDLSMIVMESFPFPSSQLSLKFQPLIFIILATITFRICINSSAFNAYTNFHGDIVLGYDVTENIFSQVLMDNLASLNKAIACLALLRCCVFQSATEWVIYQPKSIDHNNPQQYSHSCVQALEKS